MEEMYPGSLENDSVRPAGFESEEDVLNRVLLGLDEVSKFGGLSIIVGHGAVLRILDRSLGGSGARGLDTLRAWPLIVSLS